MPELFELPDDERGQRRGLATRRAVLTVFAAIPVLALSGLIGQPGRTSAAAGPAAQMRLEAPKTVRGGLFFQARLDVDAVRHIDQPRLVFDEGWVEGLQVNSIEPAAESESSRDGRLELSYPPIDAGERLRIYLQFEVNPTSVGRRSFSVALNDGTTPLARIDRNITVLP